MRTVQAIRVGDEALVPLTQLFEMAEIRFALSPAGRLEGVAHPGNLRIVFDTAGPVARWGPRAERLAREQILVREGELFVAAAPLGRLLGSRITVSWPDLAVSVDDPSGLPVAIRLKRQRARAALARREIDDTLLAASARPLDRPVWDGMVVDYALTAPSGSPIKGAGYVASVGADLFGGSLEGTISSLGSIASGDTRRQGGWTGVWNDNRWLKQLRLGDAISTGPRPRQLRGATLSNSPFVRPAAFGLATFPGIAGPGWEVETYRDGQLVAFDSADAGGRYAVRVPVQYGVNPVEFVAYGPYGEVRRFDRIYYVVEDLLRARRFEYGASLGSCPRYACDGTANLDLRYGVTSRWTARAGVERFWGEPTDGRANPYVGVAGSPTNALSAQLDLVAASMTRTSLRFQPSSDARVTAEYARFGTNAGPSLLAPAGWRSNLLVTGFWHPDWGRGYTYLQGDLDRTEERTGPTLRARIALSTQGRRGAQIAPYVRLARDGRLGRVSTRDFLGLNAFVLPEPRLGRLFGRAWFRTTVEAENLTRLYALAGSVVRPWGRGVRSEVGGTWTRGAGGAFTVLLTAELAALRAYTTTLAPTGGTPTTTQLVQGSIVWDRVAHDVDFVPGPSLQRGGVSGRVYLDANGNGRFDEGDQPIPDAFVRVAASGARADSSGRFAAWDVPPFTPVPVQVDSFSLPSPLWIPATAVATVITGPNRYLPYDIAVIPGGSVEGRVLIEELGLRRGVAAARLTLTDRRTGAARAITAFSDGAFDVIAVRPGEYALAVDPRDLERLRVRGDTVRVAVRPSPDGDRVVVDVVLTPIDQPAPPPAVVVAVPEPPIAEPPPVAAPDPGFDLRVLLDTTRAGRVAIRSILFATGSDRITMQSAPTLQAIGEFLRANPTLAVIVEGHTDDVGTVPYNLDLSRRRAAAVRRYLLDTFEIDPARIVARGYGEGRPMAPNTTPEGRQLNRRVELVRVTDR